MERVSRFGSDAAVTETTSAASLDAIPASTRAEALRLAQVELDRFVALAESLGPDDWAQPTACTLWDVRAIVAHQAEHCYYGPGGLIGFMRRYFGPDLSAYRKRGMNQLDATNQYAIDQRAGRTPAELIAELREQGPLAIRARAGLHWLPRELARQPMAGFGLISFGYLMDVLLNRDMWMHRVDICRATGRAMTCSPEHDGRIVALVMRDLGRGLRAKLGGRSVVFDLTGAAGGRWYAGPNPRGDATIHMDVLEFCVLNSGRSTAQQALAHPGTLVTGDQAFGHWVAANCQVLY